MTTKKKMGRPKLAKGDARTEILQVRLTKAELHQIAERGRESDMRASEWARGMLLGLSEP